MEHYNDRDLANIRNLLRDLDRMEKKATQLGTEYMFDEEAHERRGVAFCGLRIFVWTGRGGYRIESREHKI